MNNNNMPPIQKLSLTGQTPETSDPENLQNLSEVDSMTPIPSVVQNASVQHASGYEFGRQFGFPIPTPGNEVELRLLSLTQITPPNTPLRPPRNVFDSSDTPPIRTTLLNTAITQGYWNSKTSTTHTMNDCDAPSAPQIEQSASQTDFNKWDLMRMRTATPPITPPRWPLPIQSVIESNRMALPEDSEKKTQNNHIESIQHSNVNPFGKQFGPYIPTPGEGVRTQLFVPAIMQLRTPANSRPATPENQRHIISNSSPPFIAQLDSLLRQNEILRTIAQHLEAGQNLELIARFQEEVSNINLLPQEEQHQARQMLLERLRNELSQ